MPVCKKCRNYVMSMPCPHCGNDESFFDRRPEEFKPIIPSDLQGTFEEPPPPITSFHTADWRSEGQPNIPKGVSRDNSFSRNLASQPNDASSQFAHYSKTSSPPPSYSVQDSDSKFESGSITPKIGSEVVNRLDMVEDNVQGLRNEVAELKNDLQTIIKSQKVIETILTNLTKKILSKK